MLAIFGFGVDVRKAEDVWTSGGPWFVPVWLRGERRSLTAGSFDDETCLLEPIANPFQPTVLPMSPE